MGHGNYHAYMAAVALSAFFLIVGLLWMHIHRQGQTIIQLHRTIIELEQRQEAMKADVRGLCMEELFDRIDQVEGEHADRR